MNQSNVSTELTRHSEYRSPMDVLSIKILFILLYVVVFLMCFIGEYDYSQQWSTVIPTSSSYYMDR